MKRITELILEGCFLKKIPRSGYQFLGVGSESVAEHVYCTVFIAFIMSQLEPRADARKLLSMCLVHDLPEARTGDLNYVQKKYVKTNEAKAMSDAVQDLPFGQAIIDLMTEFKAGKTLEARLAHDADQLSLIVDLKSLHDLGYESPQTWLPHVQERLKTSTGKQLAEAVMKENRDGWWLKLFC